MLPTITGLFNLTREPKLTYMSNQTPVCEIGIAASEKYKQKERVCFHTATAFGKSAEALNKYFNKGKQILITGKVSTDQWEKDGQKRSKQKITITGWGFVSEGKSQSEPAKPEPEQEVPF